MLLVFGLGFSLFGLAVAANPGLARSIQLPNLPTAIIGIFAILLGVVTFISRRHTEFRDASDDEQFNERLEGRFEPPRPGEDIDRELRGGNPGTHGTPTNVQFRERLRFLAVQVLVDSEGLSREEAHQQLDDGTWTENRTAAAFFSEHVQPPAQDVVGSIVGFQSTYEREAHHVVRELQQIAGINAEDS